MFSREDWTLFRSLETLGQKAGVPRSRLAQLVAKELTDNALDVGAEHVTIGHVGADGFYVQDQGPGIPGGPDEIAALFSFARALVSSKSLRLPTRGALGNGLRVVAGAVLATGGKLTVTTRGRKYRLQPKDDGTTIVTQNSKKTCVGTRIEISLPGLYDDPTERFAWATGALRMAHSGEAYAGKTSPWWYTTDALFELCQAAGERTVRDLVTEFDGCAEPKAGKIAAPFKGRAANDLTRDEVEALLNAMSEKSRPVKWARLGFVGAAPTLSSAYAKLPASFRVRCHRGGPAAEIPTVIEAWAELADEPSLAMHVNRTPITSNDLNSWHEKTVQTIQGCALNISFPVGRRPVAFHLNVITPYMPITTDGKSPDLSPFGDVFVEVLSTAAKRAKRAAVSGKKDTSLKDEIFAALPAAYAKASGDGEYRASIRQTFYAARDILERPNLEWGYFTQVVTEYEAEHGEIDGLVRDPRGTLIHPHTGDAIALGTVAVEAYQRPAWTFNKILFCEKEGFFAVLQADGWPERHDCALVTSKGFASRAVRDVLDLIGDTGEPVQVFCIHDADASGTSIYQALQEATKARPKRRVEVINLGLEPKEAVEMHLKVEPLERKDKRALPVAEYVSDAWREWLQSNRVELNAMTSPQFIEWLDAKMAPYAGKVIPPEEVVHAHTVDALQRRLRADISDRILADANIDGLVADAMAMAAPPMAERDLVGVVTEALIGNDRQRWSAPLDELAIGLARDLGKSP